MVVVAPGLNNPAIYSTKCLLQFSTVTIELWFSDSLHIVAHVFSLHDVKYTYTTIWGDQSIEVKSDPKSEF